MAPTDAECKQAKPTGKTCRLFDAGGLYLEVSPSGGRWWRLKYRFDHKEKRLSLGTYPETSLKDARGRRDDARKLLADGVDPGVNRKALKRARQMDRTGCGAPDPIPSWWPLETAAHARAGLAFVIQETLSGRLPARDANAASGALSALAGAVRAADLEQRLELLERTLAHRKKRK